MTYPESYHRMMRNTTGRFPRSVPQQMWDWFCDDPAAFCELQFRKALLFWDAREIPNNVSLQYDGIMSSYVLRYLLIGRNGILFTLGIAGILFFIPLLWKNKSAGLMMLYSFSALFYGSVVVFYILSRFKAPFLPFLIIFAGGASGAWIDKLRNAPKPERVRICGKIVILLLIGFWFAFSAYNTYRDCEAAINRKLYPDGMIIDLHGDTIVHFDHGPMPFGGWVYQELTPGMIITKKFAKTGSSPFMHLTMLMRSFKPSSVELTVNGVPHRFDFPEVPLTGSGRRMVPLAAPVYNGMVEIKIVSVSGGKIWSAFDIQRCYDRSALNGQLCDGEWILRASVPRG